MLRIELRSLRRPSNSLGTKPTMHFWKLKGNFSKTPSLDTISADGISRGLLLYVTALKRYSDITGSLNMKDANWKVLERSNH